MKYKRKQFNRYTVSALSVAVIIAAAGGIIFMRQHAADAIPTKKRPVGAAVPSQFKFAGASKWWQGATNKSSVALFHHGDDCFVSTQHIKGSIEAKKAKIEKNNNYLVNEGYVIKPGANVPLKLLTSVGQKSYELQQASVITPKGTSEQSKLMGGQEYGYIQLSDNDYIFVEGYCGTYDRLSATIPALEAVRFDPAG